MEIDAKTMGTIIATALMAASGGSFMTHKAETSGAINACDGVVQQCFEQVSDQRSDCNEQLSQQRDSCDDRVKACWQQRRNTCISSDTSDEG
jgi:PBP1b-binding outer membrane lipoprotein LpoB